MNTAHLASNSAYVAIWDGTDWTFEKYQFDEDGNLLSHEMIDAQQYQRALSSENDAECENCE